MNRQDSKRLTELLRAGGAEMHSIDNEGNPITRWDALKELIWKQALGWVEQKRDANGNLQEIIHPPNKDWAQWMVERTDGRVGPSAPDTEGGMKATDKVRELTKQRLNALIPVRAGPPTHKPKAV